MKNHLFCIITALFLQACTEDKTTDSAVKETKQPQTQTKDTTNPSAETIWNGSNLSDATIKKIQQDQYTYKQCAYQEAQKQAYQKMDSRVATDAVIKQCEPTLANIRTTFTDDGVPEVITDRFLKKTRVDMTRKILQSLIFAEAARKSGATPMQQTHSKPGQITQFENK